MGLIQIKYDQDIPQSHSRPTQGNTRKRHKTPTATHIQEKIKQQASYSSVNDWRTIKGSTKYCITKQGPNKKSPQIMGLQETMNQQSHELRTDSSQRY